MAEIKPFRALRPAPGRAEDVITLPYDTMNREEAVRMARSNPDSFLHVGRSEIDLPDVEDPYDHRVYEKARENLQDLIRRGVLVQDEEPMLYVYREIWNGSIQTGIVGCSSVEDYRNGVIRRHELTRRAKENDRIRHIMATRANTGSVFLVYRENPALRAVLEDITSRQDPEVDVVSFGAVRHQVWPVREQNVICRIVELFREIPTLYIADGHHRCRASAIACEKFRIENPDWTGEEPFNYTLATFLPDRDLHCLDYNRVVRDFNGMSAVGFMKAVTDAGFRLERMGTEPYRPRKLHEFGVYFCGTWFRMTAEDRVIPPAEDVIGSLDVSILQNSLLAPVLGIRDPRSDDRIDFVGGIRGLEEVQRRAESDMKIGFALFPLPVQQLFRAADAGKTMPPKSTWFEPKLASGLFVHLL